MTEVAVGEGVGQSQQRFLDGIQQSGQLGAGASAVVGQRGQRRDVGQLQGGDGFQDQPLLGAAIG